MFLTNHLELPATTIAAIYGERWQIELLFKVLKQNLRIKTLVDTTANALKTQIWTALIALLAVKLLQLQATFPWSLSRLVALFRQQLFVSEISGDGWNRHWNRRSNLPRPIRHSYRSRWSRRDPRHQPGPRNAQTDRGKALQINRAWSRSPLIWTPVNTVVLGVPSDEQAQNTFTFEWRRPLLAFEHSDTRTSFCGKRLESVQWT